ncbi:MAG TPA: transcription antitermination factor NusB [Pirellulaceae bacterium]|nr:transcription antitermination factor NusB [Pirellulaceae bacterium]
MSRRSRAREVVLQVLYEDDLNPDRNLAAAEDFLAARLNREEDLLEFARGLLSGVRRNRGELDQILSQVADNWPLARMAVTDRNVLRLGAYELLYTDAPGPVAIDESVELAKRFGAKQSPQFVNGILDRLLKKKEGTPPRKK